MFLVLYKSGEKGLDAKLQVTLHVISSVRATHTTNLTQRTLDNGAMNISGVWKVSTSTNINLCSRETHKCFQGTVVNRTWPFLIFKTKKWILLFWITPISLKNCAQKPLEKYKTTSAASITESFSNRHLKTFSLSPLII